MTRHILFSIVLTFGLSYNLSRQEKQVELNVAGSSETQLSVTGSNKAQEKIKENIRFDFKVARINNFKETIEITATLFNDNTDTAYFLSSTCDGEQYSLRYDTSKFVLTPFLNCNRSIPKIIKIAPKGHHDFQAHFSCNSTETKIK